MMFSENRYPLFGIMLYNGWCRYLPRAQQMAARGESTDRSMNELSPAQRVRRMSVLFGAVVSIALFVLLANEILVSQLLEGHASLLYILGTACVIAGACLLVFA